MTTRTELLKLSLLRLGRNNTQNMRQFSPFWVQDCLPLSHCAKQFASSKVNNLNGPVTKVGLEVNGGTVCSLHDCRHYDKQNGNEGMDNLECYRYSRSIITSVK
jgi:hypothetical protein